MTRREQNRATNRAARGPVETHFVPLFSESSTLREALKEHFGLQGFPFHQVYVRECEGMAEGSRRQLTLVSEHAAAFISGDRNDRIKVIHAGARVLSRLSTPAKRTLTHRLAQECVDIVDPFVTRNRVNVCFEDVIMLLKCDNPKTEELTAHGQQAFAPNGEYIHGPTLVVFDPALNPDPRCRTKNRFCFAEFGGATTRRMLVSKEER